MSRTDAVEVVPLRVEYGRDEPRLVTPLPGGVASMGERVAEWAAENLGVELMSWQALALRGMLTLDDPQMLTHRRSLISVARQSGKTTILRALAGWWLLEGPEWRGGPQTVLLVSHRLDHVREFFESLAPVITRMQPKARTQWSFGREAITLPDGPSWFAPRRTVVGAWLLSRPRPG